MHPAGQLAEPSRDGLVVDVDAHEGFGASPAGGSGAGAVRHLHEGVGSPLGGGPGQVIGSGVVAVGGLGGLPVGVEQLAFEAFELVEARFAADGVEQPVTERHAAIAAALQIEAALVVERVGGVVELVVDGVAPRDQDPPEVVPGGLLVGGAHQERLVGGELGGSQTLAAGRRPGVLHAHRTGSQRVGDQRHRPQPAGPGRRRCGPVPASSAAGGRTPAADRAPSAAHRRRASNTAVTRARAASSRATCESSARCSPASSASPSSAGSSANSPSISAANPATTPGSTVPAAPPPYELLFVTVPGTGTGKQRMRAKGLTFGLLSRSRRGGPVWRARSSSRARCPRVARPAGGPRAPPRRRCRRQPSPSACR